MKKLLLLLALLVLPLSVAAEESDILLSSSGALYTMSSETPAPDSGSEASTHLVLTEHRGDRTVREVVPASMVRGTHLNALLGYDTESGTLFVFWIQHFGFLYNQLLFCTRDSDGVWSEAQAFGSPYNYREHLRIAVTRKVTDVTDHTSSRALTVHATWWEFDTQSGLESAQYRMLSIENGRVADVAALDLNEFVARPVVADGVTEQIDGGSTDMTDMTVLKQPILAPSAQQESVLLVFGDAATRNFTKVRITPSRGVVANGRLRVPVGRSEGGFGAPRFSVASTSRMEGIFGEANPAVFYTVNDNMLRYVMLSNGGTWSDVRAVTLDEKITSGAAVNALRRMIAEQ
ncbi:MAG TPA: hypothetical protein VE010_19320 [Thermoanaerobaculia bacterium]|nr:hypothetical protein [Thermoanaerobaculia bacterium]